MASTRAERAKPQTAACIGLRQRSASCAPVVRNHIARGRTSADSACTMASAASRPNSAVQAACPLWVATLRIRSGIAARAPAGSTVRHDVTNRWRASDALAADRRARVLKPSSTAIALPSAGTRRTDTPSTPGAWPAAAHSLAEEPCNCARSTANGKRVSEVPLDLSSALRHSASSRSAG